MHRFPRVAALCLTLIGAVALSACAPKVDPNTSRAPVPATPTGGFDPNRPVVVAMLSPLSAQNAGAANLGQALANAARMAHVRLNDQLIDLRIYDTAGDPATAAAAAQRAVADGAKLIVGPLFGSSTREAGAVASGASIRVISFSTDSSVAGGPVYLSGFLPEMEARRIINFAKVQGYGSLAVLHPRTAYGEAALRGARDAAGQAGVQLVHQGGYERTEAGISGGASTFAQAAGGAGARAILLADGGQGVRLVADNVSGAGLSPETVKYLGLGQWNSRATLDTPALQGGWFPAPDPAALRAFVADYRKSFKSTPPALALLGYDAVLIAGQMLAQARANGSQDPFGAAAITRPQGFAGVVGPIRFARNGIGERGMAILEVGNGAFKTIEAAPATYGAGS